MRKLYGFIALSLLAAASIAAAIWLGRRPGHKGSEEAARKFDTPAPLAEQRQEASAGDPDGPLAPVLKWARQMEAHISKDIQDYSAVFVKQERKDGTLSPPQSMFIKIRNHPFSVYLHFLEPENRRGEEAIYIAGQNDGKLLGHTTGLAGKVAGTVALDPNGWIAMRGTRRPITEIGILNLCRRLIEFGEREQGHAETRVCRFPGVKINGRSCTCIEVVHPERSPTVYYHLLRIYVDDQFNVPVRFEAYDWPKQPGDEPELAEEYTYLDLKLNPGFSNRDFDVKNPQYSFP